MFGAWACIVPFSDAGRPCSSKADCQGRCLVGGEGSPNSLIQNRTGSSLRGQCERTNKTFGCYGAIEGGKLVQTICED